MTNILCKSFPFYSRCFETYRKYKNTEYYQKMNRNKNVKNWKIFLKKLKLRRNLKNIYIYIYCRASILQLAIRNAVFIIDIESKDFEGQNQATGNKLEWFVQWFFSHEKIIKIGRWFLKAKNENFQVDKNIINLKYCK